MSYKYPYGWSQSQIEPFLEKYARGLYRYAKMSGIEPKEAAQLLIYSLMSGNSTRLEGLKLTIKRLEWLSNAEIRRLPPEQQANYLTYVEWEAQDSYLDSF